MRAGCDRRTARAPRRRRRASRRHGRCEQRVEFLQTLVEREQLVAAVDQEVLAELVAPVHLEHQSAKVTQPLFAGAQQRASLAPQQAGMRKGPPRRGLRAG